MKHIKTSLLALWNQLPACFRYGIQICIILSVLNMCLRVIQGFSTQQYFPDIESVVNITIVSEYSDDMVTTYDENSDINLAYNNLIIYSRFRLFGQRDENWKLTAYLTLEDGNQYVIRFSNHSVYLNGIVKPLYYQAGTSLSALNQKLF